MNSGPVQEVSVTSLRAFTRDSLETLLRQLPAGTHTFWGVEFHTSLSGTYVSVAFDYASAQRDLADLRANRFIAGRIVSRTIVVADSGWQSESHNGNSSGGEEGWHVTRGTGPSHLEANCPCPKEACGAVDSARAVDACTQHPAARARTMRNIHLASECPARINSALRG